MIKIDVDPKLQRSTQIVMNAMGLDVGLLSNHDPAFHRKQIDAWLKQYDVEIEQYPWPNDGKNIVKYLHDAGTADGYMRTYYIFRAYRAAHMIYFGLHKKIHKNDNPMPDDVKEELAERREAKRIAEGKPPRGTVVKKGPSKGRVPIYEDKAAQVAKERQYPWVKHGSWRKDPAHEGGTILEIICQTAGCGTERTIHAGDAFQVKFCTTCKKKGISKPTGKS